MANEETGEGDKSAPPGGLSGTSQIDRNELLNMLSGILVLQHLKLKSGRIRDAKNEKIRLEALRGFSYLCSVYSSILKDKDLTDIGMRLEALENAKNE